MNDTPAEVRRAAADEIHVEIWKTIDLLAETIRLGHQGGMEWSSTPSELKVDAPAFVDHLRRLHWLLGLSDAERRFVDDAASAAVGGRTTDAYESLMVFADWLEDNLRTEHGGAIRKLTPQDGDTLVINYPKGDMDARRAIQRYFLEVQEKLREMGREVSFVVLPEGLSVIQASAAEMALNGWARASDLAALRREAEELRAHSAELREAVAKLQQQIEDERESHREELACWQDSD